MKHISSSPTTMRVASQAPVSFYAPPKIQCYTRTYMYYTLDYPVARKIIMIILFIRRLIISHTRTLLSRRCMNESYIPRASATRHVSVYNVYMRDIMLYIN